MVNDTAFPPRGALTIAFAHVAYRAAEEFAARGTGIAHFEVRTLEDLERRARDADVLVVSGLWRNTLMARAPKLRFVQSFSAGTDQYDKALFAERGVRLANAQGVNERAVAEHAIALILALTRQLHLARDNQREALWRGMIGDRALREQELGGKTLVVIGLGRIGTRLARLARAFDMRVIGVRRTARPAPDAADEVLARDGADAFTTTRIAQVAGVPVGSVYRYFPDKQAIAEALATRYWSEFAGLVAAAAARDEESPLPDPAGGVLEALAARRDIHLWLTHPSPGMWGELAGRAPTARRADDDTAVLALGVQHAADGGSFPA